MIKVSVIVPIYNVEMFLEECVESIKAQSLKEIEIILANDGSIDDSYILAQKIASTDNRIRLLSHSNIGLGPTRNDALQYAQGEYLAFVDSDDYIDRNALQIMYEKAKCMDADVVQAETMMFDGSKVWKRKDFKNVEDISLNKCNIDYFFRKYYFRKIYSHNAWDKLYKRSYVINYNILFGDNKRIFAEDNWFQLQVLLHNPKISFVSIPYYWYRQQEESIMHKPKFNLLNRHERMITDYYELIQQNISANDDRKSELRTLSLLSFDILVIELWNQRISAGKLTDYLCALQDINEKGCLYEGICMINVNQAYLYEGNPVKRILYTSISSLYKKKQIKFANTILWLIYKFLC